jgi:hypothetical protein
MMEKGNFKEQVSTNYEKPDIIKIEKMTFMFEAYKKGMFKITCRQCSGCHGCR